MRASSRGRLPPCRRGGGWRSRASSDPMIPPPPAFLARPIAHPRRSTTGSRTARRTAPFSAIRAAIPGAMASKCDLQPSYGTGVPIGVPRRTLERLTDGRPGRPARRRGGRSPPFPCAFPTTPIPTLARVCCEEVAGPRPPPDRGQGPGRRPRPLGRRPGAGHRRRSGGLRRPPSPSCPSTRKAWPPSPSPRPASPGLTTCAFDPGDWPVVPEGRLDLLATSPTRCGPAPPSSATTTATSPAPGVSDLARQRSRDPLLDGPLHGRGDRRPRHAHTVTFEGYLPRGQVAVRADERPLTPRPPRHLLIHGRLAIEITAHVSLAGIDPADWDACAAPECGRWLVRRRTRSPPTASSARSEESGSVGRGAAGSRAKPDERAARHDDRTARRSTR